MAKKINSRSKGKRRELELAHEIERIFNVPARRGQQYCGGGDSPDVICGIPGVHIECKGVERLNINQAMDQAVADCGEKVPSVWHIKNRQPWMVTVRLDDLLAFATQVYLTRMENN